MSLMSSVFVEVSSGVDVVGLRSIGCSEFCGGDWGDSGGIDPQSGGLGLLGVNLSERLGVSRILFLFFMLPQILCGLSPVVGVPVSSVLTEPFGYFRTLFLFLSFAVTGGVADLFFPLP